MATDYSTLTPDREPVSRLLAEVAAIGDDHAGLAERREAILAALMELVNAQAGVWAWGRGWPDSSGVIPVAVIYRGVSDEQRGALMVWGFDPETDRTFRQPIREQMGDRRAISTLWQDIFTRAQWAARPAMRTQLAIGGWGSWLHSVRYSDRDTWSNFFLLRDDGLGDFSAADAALTHLVLESVPWLHSTAEEYLPPESFAGLTARQRTVMLMLLDGMPRKTIARRMQITEDTVGDHLKAIYAHFQVSSASELAAQFLRGR